MVGREIISCYDILKLTYIVQKIDGDLLTSKTKLGLATLYMHSFNIESMDEVIA